MHIIATLEKTLKTKRKTLTERQTTHLHATIAYLKALPKDFISAKREYDETMKEIKDH